ESAEQHRANVVRIRSLLKNEGLDSKDPTVFSESRVLGLQLYRDSEGDRLLHDGNLTFRDCGSWLGQLLGHLPVADWLRPVVGLGRRSLGKKAGNTKASWRRLVDDESKQICLYICQLLRRLGDPAHGTWRTPDPSEELHCFIDSSELAMG
ncbi:hypothetical protein FOZ63_017694, partial [Perkinsus olseni]